MLLNWMGYYMLLNLINYYMHVRSEVLITRVMVDWWHYGEVSECRVVKNHCDVESWWPWVTIVVEYQLRTYKLKKSLMSKYLEREWTSCKLFQFKNNNGKLTNSVLLLPNIFFSEYVNNFVSASASKGQWQVVVWNRSWVQLWFIFVYLFLCCLQHVELREQLFRI